MHVLPSSRVLHKTPSSDGTREFNCLVVNVQGNCDDLIRSLHVKIYQSCRGFSNWAGMQNMVFQARLLPYLPPTSINSCIRVEWNERFDLQHSFHTVWVVFWVCLPDVRLKIIDMSAGSTARSTRAISGLSRIIFSQRRNARQKVSMRPSSTCESAVNV